MPDPIDSLAFTYQDDFAPAGTTIPVGTTTFGPFDLGGFSGILVDVTRSDDGASGTLAGVMTQDNHALGATQSVLDGAGAQIEFNNWAAGENVRRQLQVHPTAGPCPADDADGVFKVGTTGVASNYYRQPVPSPFYLEFTAAVDTSTISGTIYFLR